MNEINTMASQPDMVSVSGTSLLAVHWEIVFIAVPCLSCCMQVDILHPCASLKWRKCKRLPEGMSEAQAVWLRDKLYVGGGSTLGNIRDAARLYIYTPTSDTWNYIDTSVYWFALITYHSRLVLVGGREYVGVGKHGPVTNKLWTLTEHDQWRETLPPMTTKRQWASAVEYADYILVVGGDDELRNIDIVEVYNGHHWARAQCLPKPCYWMKSTVLNGHWYLMGGWRPENKVYYASLDSLVASCQPSEKPLPPVWKRLPDVPHDRSSTTVFGNRVIAVGGGGYLSLNSSIHAYSPYTQSWVHVGDMSVGLSSTCTAVLPTGELMVIGGVSDTSLQESSVHKANLNGNREWYTILCIRHILFTLNVSVNYVHQGSAQDDLSGG